MINLNNNFYKNITKILKFNRRGREHKYIYQIFTKMLKFNKN